MRIFKAAHSPTWIARARRYLLVGIITNATLFLVYLAFTAAGLPYLLSSVLVFIFGTCLAYVSHRRFSFDSTERHRIAAPLFATAYGTGLATQSGVLYVLAGALGLPHPVSQLVAMGAATAIIFYMLNAFVFPVNSR